ncbi:MAG: MoaD/ThiS family protein [Chloroflexota bacterium]
MQVTVKLYATLTRYGQSERAGAPFTIEMPEHATLQQLIEQLNIPAQETKVMFVNGIIREFEFTLKDGDEVGIFPPIGGG